MKFLLLIALTTGAYAAKNVDKLKVHTVEDIEYKGDTALVKVSNSAKTYEVDRKNKIMPCLWNGWMAPQEVVIGLDEESGKILDCKLHARGVPHLKNVKKMEY